MEKTGISDVILYEDSEGGNKRQSIPLAAVEGTRLILLRSSQEQNHFLVT